MKIDLPVQNAQHGPHFRAYGLRGRQLPELIDPFMNVDHAWMSAPTFPPHRHAGFSAISYVLPDSETGLANRDSLGTQNLIAPGGLHWTAAGGGIVHEEVPAEPGKTAHALQIFVMLPPGRENDAAFALSLEASDVPVVTLPGVVIRVPLGRFGETASPLAPPTPVTVLDIAAEAGQVVEVPIEPGHVALAMPITGPALISGEAYAAEDLRVPLFRPTGEARSLAIGAAGAPARIVFFSGRPLHVRGG